jgi:hypothetical protein
MLRRERSVEDGLQPGVLTLQTEAQVFVKIESGLSFTAQADQVRTS